MHSDDTLRKQGSLTENTTKETKHPHLCECEV